MQYPSHATGSLHFGPDGYLYASAGEGAHYSQVDHGLSAAGRQQAEALAAHMAAAVAAASPSSQDGNLPQTQPPTSPDARAPHRSSNARAPDTATSEPASSKSLPFISHHAKNGFKSRNKKKHIKHI